MIIRNRGFLPHYEKDQATYLVTFRLAGSLPATVLNACNATGMKLYGMFNLGKGRYRCMKNIDLASLSERVEKYLDSGKGHPSIKEMLNHETGGLEARAPSSED